MGPDLGPNSLKWLSADDNFMLKFNALLNYISLKSKLFENVISR